MNIETLQKILKGIELAYLFGSYARGSQDEYSDLDILVVKETERDFFHRFQEFPA